MTGRPKRKAAEHALQQLTTKRTARSTHPTKPVATIEDEDKGKVAEAEPAISKKRNITKGSGSADGAEDDKASPKPKPKPQGKANKPVTDVVDQSDEKEETGTTGPRCWLMKAEPETRMEKGVDVKFSIDDLEEKTTSCWDGVRSYEARNHMRAMKVGDPVFFYHSNCKLPGIAGLAEVHKEAYPDYSAWDPKHPYFDPKTDKDNPKWEMVDVKFVRKLRRFISLKELQSHKDGALKNMFLIKRGRLSVQPVGQPEWEFILSLEDLNE
ncbi:Thymocyte nuclear protein 1 [Thoreauomyces humboldtii]|nr:Thymocyte nuclear protein 1 [Thoreauomyces humboldtii]